MIKNIVLDMGNVIFDFNPEVSLNLYCSSEEEKDLIRKELFLGPEWALGDKGVIKDRERFEYVKKRVPKEHWEALRQCVQNWSICMNPLKGAREFCDCIKEKGYKLFLLTNASDLFYSYFPKFAPFDYFNGIIVSSDYLMLKPDMEIYKLLLDKFNLNPKECLFIDDRLENVQGAEKAGMHGMVFRDDYAEIMEIFHL